MSNDWGSPQRSVTQMWEVLAQAAQAEGLGESSVIGTVSGLRHRARVVTFDLIDPTDTAGTAALLRCVVFARHRHLTDRLVDGMRIVAGGGLELDPVWGVRLVVDYVHLVAERSAEGQAWDAMVDQLRAEGVLNAQHALVPPGRPLTVAVITGAHTAGAADVAAVLEHSGVELQVWHRQAPMAGPRAAAEVAAAVADLGRHGPDLIVIARGGGARAELGWADTEVLARAIGACPVPVWTAIGHATDQTLADVAANAAWPTPSAAASAIIDRVQAWETARNERVVLHEHRAQVAELAAQRHRARMAAALVVLVAVLVLAATVVL